MKNQIKELRVKIDGLAQLTKNLKPINSIFLDVSDIPEELTVEKWVEIAKKTSPYVFIQNNEPSIESVHYYKEIDKAVDNLYLAKAWLGKILGELGAETPYANDGKRKSVEDIEPAADQSWYKKEELNHDMNFDLFKEKNHIEKVDWLRQEIEILVSEVKEIARVSSNSFTKEFNISRTNSYNYLCEARFWLGFELQRIKEND